MKNILIILIGMLAGQAAFPQNIGILQTDSLRRELAKAKQDTTRALIMADLAEAYRSEKPDSTLYFAEKALQLSRSINFTLGEMRAHMVICYHFMNTVGDLAQSLKAGLKALEIAEKHNFKNYQGACMIRIGHVYLALNDLREALHYYQRANQVLRDGSHPFFYTVTYWFFAETYLRMNMTDSSLYMARIAFDKAVQINNDLILGSVLGILARVYSDKGDSRLALQYYHWSIATSAKNNQFAMVAERYLSLANFFKNLKQNDSAIYYAKKAYELAQPRSSIATEMYAATLLSKLFEPTDPGEALRYLKIANEARDSIYSAEKMQSLQAISFKEKERQNELELEKTAYQNRLRQYALLAGIGLLLFIVFVLYKNNRSKLKANHALENQKNKVEKTLAELRSTQAQLIQREKMASLGELTAGVAHEIQNPLNFVNNFSEVNKELLAEMNEGIDKGNFSDVKTIAKDIAENEEKINHHGKRADAIVKGMLQHSRSGSGVKEPTDINALTDEYLRLSYHGLRAKDKSFNSTIKTDYDDSIGEINIIPQDMGRVILNLINNAFYAVDEKKKIAGDSYEPVVIVSTKAVKPRPTGGGLGALISVKDNGNGISQKVLDKIFQPFFTTKPTGQGTGLGLSLSYDIVKAHSGELKVTTNEGEGSEFIIQIPVN